MRSSNIIYADNAATTQLHPKALEKMLPYLSNQPGNGSSTHHFGREARQILEEARVKIRTLLGGEDHSQIIFTSGGTEANNLAIKGFMAQSEKKQLITSQIEHSSVLETAKYLENQGVSVTYLPVEEHGLVSLEALEQAISSETALVSVMYANNEVGTIQEIEKISGICRFLKVPLHCDGVQAVGQLPINLSDLDISMLSMSAHKFHGPQGVGALYVKDGISLSSQLHGGGQEKALRAGTENLAGVIGMAVALETAFISRNTNTAHLQKLRRILLDQITSLPQSQHTGHPEKCLTGIVSFVFADVTGEGLQMFLDLKGICCATGSACHAGNKESSHVLKAMGISPNLLNGALRISLSEGNTLEEAQEIALQVRNGVETLRKLKK